jgi:chloride channel 7
VYDLLRSCSHGTFPIVDTESGGTLYGTASRSMLCTLLQRRAFGSPDVFNDEDAPHEGVCESLGPRRLSPLVQWDTMERAYPRYPTIGDVEMRDGDRNCWLDLRPYANTAPYTVNETASIQVSTITCLLLDTACLALSLLDLTQLFFRFVRGHTVCSERWDCVSFA